MDTKHGYSISIDHLFDEIPEQERQKIYSFCEGFIEKEIKEDSDFKILENEHQFYQLNIERKSDQKIITVYVDMNREMEDAMNGMAEEEKKHYENMKRINGRILKAIESVCGKEFVQSLHECAEELEVSESWEIVNKPHGEYQDENYGVIPGVWVDQWRNGGYTGDDFAGDIYVKIKDDKYLKMYYSC